MRIRSLTTSAMRRLVSLSVCCLLVGILVSSCSSGENKAKQTVKDFCEAYQSQQSDKAAALFPAFTAGVAKAAQIDLENLKATRENDVWKVDDGVDHIFYVAESGDKYVIKDSKNVIEWESKTGGDVKAAEFFRMVNDASTDIERINAYSMLADGSDFINFLKEKHPQAFVYNITVDNIRKKKEGGYGIYWMDAKATLKSGATKPLGMIKANFIFKDKDGNIVWQKDNPVYISNEFSTDEVGQTVDLGDYPTVTDVEVKLLPFGKQKGADIDMLYIYGELNPREYQEYLDSKK